MEAQEGKRLCFVYGSERMGQVIAACMFAVGEHTDPDKCPRGAFGKEQRL